MIENISNDSFKAYGVTKAAQLHMIKALASMVGPKIRVNTVSPGLLETVGCYFSSSLSDL